MTITNYDNNRKSSSTSTSVCRENSTRGDTTTFIAEDFTPSYYSHSYSSSPSTLYHLMSREEIEEALLLLKCKTIPYQLKTKLLFYKGWDGVGYSNALHKTLSDFSHFEKGKEIVKLMIDIGGRELIMEKGNGGNSVLHSAVFGHRRAGFDIVREITRFGGKELLLQQDAFGNNILHSLCSHSTYRQNITDNVGIIRYFVDVAGKDLILQQNNEGNTSMHLVCMKPSFDLIQCFIDRGGNASIGMVNKYGDLPIHLLVRRFNHKSDLDSLKLLIDEGISFGIGGEYAIGGLFLQCQRLHCRGERITILEMLMKKIRSQRKKLFFDIDNMVYGLPIIQAAIEAKVADIEVIRDLIIYFDWSIVTRNNLGQLPIHIGAANGLSWKHGGMKLIADACKESLYEIDPVTGLFPYALAAAGDSDLETIYRLVQCSVQTIV